MAYDSFAGGLARGIANSQKMALMKEESERLKKIAKLEGQLTEQKLLEQTRLTEGREFIEEQLAPDLQNMLPSAPGTVMGDAIATGRVTPKAKPDLLTILSDPKALAALSEYKPLLDVREKEKTREMMERFMPKPGGPDGGGTGSFGVANITVDDEGPSFRLEPTDKARRGGAVIPLNIDGHSLQMNVTRDMRGQEMLQTATPVVGDPVEVEIAGAMHRLKMLGGHPEGSPGYKAALKYMKDRQNRPEGQPTLDLKQDQKRDLPGLNMGQVGTTDQPPGILVKEADRDKRFTNEQWNMLRDVNGERPKLTDRNLSQNEMLNLGFGMTDTDTRKALNNATFMTGRIDKLQTEYEGLFPKREDGSIDPNSVPTTQQFANAPDIIQLEDIKFDQEKKYSSEAEFVADSGYYQAVKSRFAIAAGKGPQAQALRLYFDQYLSLAVQIARQVLGEVGTMTEGDVSRALGILPFPGVEVDDKGSIKFFSLKQADTYASGLQKINNIKALINTRPEVTNWQNQFQQKSPYQQALEEKARRQNKK